MSIFQHTVSLLIVYPIIQKKTIAVFQVSDAEYLEAARNGDEEKAPECFEQSEPILKKEKEVDVAGHTSLNEQDWTNLLSTSTYSIRDIFKNINPVDKLLKICVGFRCKATEYHEDRYLSKNSLYDY